MTLDIIETPDIVGTGFKKFPKIGQFKDAVRTVRRNWDYVETVDGTAVYEHTSPYPVITFTGTPKIHGTNAGIRVQGGVLTPQSRTRDLSLMRDNAGFALFVHTLPQEVVRAFGKLTGTSTSGSGIIYGEWCGAGIQKGVAVCELSKRLVIFGVRECDGSWADISSPAYAEVIVALNEFSVYSIHQFQTYTVTVDMNAPEDVQNKLCELTELVEGDCPVGSFFGVHGVGEGIVYTFEGDYSEVSFKVKGAKHASSKCKTLAPVDVERINGIAAFADMVVTESRLNQGLEHIAALGMIPERKHTGTFMKFVIADALSEERHQLQSMGLTAKDVNGAISNACRSWWFKITDSFVAQ